MFTLVEGEVIHSVRPVNDKPRSPVMAAELHIHLDGSIFDSGLPGSQLERNNA